MDYGVFCAVEARYHIFSEERLFSLVREEGLSVYNVLQPQ